MLLLSVGVCVGLIEIVVNHNGFSTDSKEDDSEILLFVLVYTD